MSNNDPADTVDDVLKVLSKPLSKYVLSVLAGVDPGEYIGPIEVDDENQD